MSTTEPNPKASAMLLRMVDGVFILGEKYALIPTLGRNPPHGRGYWSLRSLDTGEMLQTRMQMVGDVMMALLHFERAGVVEVQSECEGEACDGCSDPLCGIPEGYRG